MRFYTTINLDNDAFHNGDGPWELARILRALAGKIEFDGLGRRKWPLMDVNGNRIGEAKVFGKRG